AAFALGFGGTGTDQFSVQGPPPQGVGVAMVPDQTVQKPQFGSILRIPNVTFEHDFQQQLWQTILPFNLTGVPQGTVAPAKSPQQLQLHVRTYILGSSNTLTDTTTGAGAPPFALDDGQPNLLARLAGKTVLFRVEPVQGQPLETGIYSL